MGGLWSDALGEGGAARYPGIERRCNSLLRAVDISESERARAVADKVPPPEPEEAYYPMRAIEPQIVEAIAKRVESVAKGDPAQAPHAQEEVTLLRAIAAAAREAVHARRYADRVKDDVRDPPPAEARAEDKRKAAESLQAGEALAALLHVDVGPYTDEARAIGWMMALDRMEIARGLPKHLKIEGVRTAYREVFGVAAPAVPQDASAPVKTGMWLTYLTDVAAAAGHPVPAEARSPQNREPLAWTGVLQGFADRLRGPAARPETPAPLAAAERGIVARLDQEFKDEREAYLAHAPADR